MSMLTNSNIYANFWLILIDFSHHGSYIPAFLNAKKILFDVGHC